MNLVIDGSATLAILLPDEKGSPQAALINDAVTEADALLAPAHWLLETTNGILYATKGGRLGQLEAVEVLGIVQSLNVAFDNELNARVQRVFLLAQQHSLTIYDAAYLELAIRKDATLATLDKALKRAAEANKVPCIPA
ncbi:MAG: type II toxin-antitoxin system VapC family toxin [Puniceicoccales bacterium]|nr:type II toxin-antitoxin system VapC family toxin [Puniceicoccales bacterium]